MAERKENIVMLPFMAQGHLIPFLALALQIEQRGYNVIFVNTPLNIIKLQQSLPPTSSIRLLQIPFNSSDHDLPPGAENTDVLPPNLIFSLVKASISLKPPFRQLISDLTTQHGGAPPLCVIADIFFGWSVEVAHEFGVFHTIFSCASAFGLACYYSLWLNLPHRNTDSADFSFPDFPESGLFHTTQLAANMLAADGNDPPSIFQRKNNLTWSNSDGLLFNSVEALDGIGLAYFRRKLGRQVWPVGPILFPGVRSGKHAGITAEKCIEWLDAKPINSVLYISFGSNNTISASQMMQLAKALEQVTNVNFVWVVRPPLGFDITTEFRAEKWLPEGFIERVVDDQKRGLIVVQWAPQMEILSHKSVGSFLTHCGWNSVLEALSRGVPLMGWPMGAEQFFNAKLLAEEIGVCVEVARGIKFELKHEDMVEKIELVMGQSEKGKEMRKKAVEMKEMIKDAVRDKEGIKGSSVEAMDGFLNAALLTKEKTKNGYTQHNTIS
ncbi:unnamed protein product [Camellia sinensis]|nr:UDP-glycosyltransferases 7 [Camellia sinensis]